MKLNQVTTLSEALNTPYPYKWTKATAHRYDAEYDDLSVSFMNRAKNKRDWEIAFEVNGHEGITGEGDAFKILSTVIAATNEWWTRQDPADVQIIKFSAAKDQGEGDGRSALYSRFAQRFAKRIGFALQIRDTHQGAGVQLFVLTNPNYVAINEDGRVVQGVNTTPDVKTGETRRQAVKFGNKLNSKNEPPLLNDRARKNSNPHILNNLGLTEVRQLTELFDKIHDWKWVSMEDDFAQAAFQSADDGLVRVNFELGLRGNVAWDVEFIKNYTFDATNEGDQFAIFATVMEIIGDFVHIRKPGGIVFTADKNAKTGSNSRAGLYTKMVNKFANKINMKSTITNNGRKTVYKLVKEAVMVAEVLDTPYPFKLKPEGTALVARTPTPNGELLIMIDEHDDEYVIDFAVGGNMGNTDAGDAFKIFATVKAVIGQWLSKADISTIKIIEFSADKVVGVDESRTKLYRRFANMMSKKIGFQLSSTTTGGGDTDFYTMTNPDYVNTINERKTLTELFDKTHDWRWAGKSPTLVKAEFESTDGGTITVFFKSTSPTSTHYEVAFKKGDTMKRTGDGDQFAILATVMEIISAFMKENPDAESMDFVAKREGLAATHPKYRDSRASLYKRMLTSVAKSNNLEIAWDTVGRMTEFMLRRKDTDMTEEYKKPRPEDTLGVKRANMPQVHEKHYPELFAYFKDAGATMTKAMVAADSLKAVQGEFSDAGIERMINAPKGGKGTNRSKPLIVSMDNYIIDGHHRWLASYNMDEDISIIKVGLPVKTLLQLVKDFKHTTYKNINNTVAEARLETMRQACIEGGHDLRDLVPPSIKKEGVNNEKTTNRRGTNRN